MILIRKATIAIPPPPARLFTELKVKPGFHQYVGQILYYCASLRAVITMNGTDLTTQQQSQDLQSSSNSTAVITMNGTEEADLTSQQQSQQSSIDTVVTKDQELDRRKRQVFKCLKVLLMAVFAVIGVSVLLIPSMIYYFPLPLVSLSCRFPQLYQWLDSHWLYASIHLSFPSILTTTSILSEM